MLETIEFWLSCRARTNSAACSAEEASPSSCWWCTAWWFYASSSQCHYSQRDRLVLFGAGLHNVFIKEEVNCSPLSKTTWCGMPKLEIFKRAPHLSRLGLLEWHCYGVTKSPVNHCEQTLADSLTGLTRSHGLPMSGQRYLPHPITGHCSV